MRRATGQEKEPVPPARGARHGARARAKLPADHACRWPCIGLASGGPAVGKARRRGCCGAAGSRGETGTWAAKEHVVDRPARTHGSLPSRAVQVAVGSGRVATARDTLARRDLRFFHRGWLMAGLVGILARAPINSLRTTTTGGVISLGQSLSQPLQLAAELFSGRVPLRVSLSLSLPVDIINK